jgi:hypothetical protein
MGSVSVRMFGKVTIQGSLSLYIYIYIYLPEWIDVIVENIGQYSSRDYCRVFG